MHKARLRWASLLLVAVAVAGCRDTEGSTGPTFTPPRATQSLEYAEPTDSILVQVALDSAGSDSLHVYNNRGKKKSVYGNGYVWVQVPSTRPTLVYVMRAIDEVPVGFGLVTTHDLGTHTMRIDGEKALKSLAVMHPIAMPRTLGGLDTVSKYAHGSTSTTIPARDLENAMWNGQFATDSVPDLPATVQNYIEETGENLAVASQGAPALHSPATMTHTGGLPGGVPWVSLSPNTGGPGAWIVPGSSRTNPVLTIQKTTTRGLIALTYGGNAAANSERMIADAVEMMPEKSGSFMELALGKVVTLANAGPSTEEIQIPSAEAARYWGADSSFRVKLMLGTLFPTGTLSEDEKAAVKEIGWKTIATSVAGYALNVADANPEFDAVNPTTYPCTRQALIVAAKATPDLAEYVGNAVNGTPVASHAADTAFAKVVTSSVGDCVTDLAQSTLQGPTKRIMARIFKKGAEKAAKSFLKGASFVLELGSLDAAMKAALPSQSSDNMQTWTVTQTWLSDIEWPQSNGSDFPTRAAGGSTITLSPRARLNTYQIDAVPGDLQASGVVTGTAQYLTSPYRLRAPGNGTGAISYSWISSPSGSRTTRQTPTVQFCSPTAFRTQVVGAGGAISTIATVRLDSILFSHQVQLPATCGGGGWVPWETVNTQVLWTTGSPGVQTQTTTVAGSPSITRAWFAGTGGQIRFRSIFRNPLTTPTPNGIFGEFDWTQSVGPGRIEAGPPTQNATLPAGGSTSGSFYGTYYDANGNQRGINVCFKGDGEAVQPGVCWSTRPIISTGIKYFRGYVLQQPGLESNRIEVKVYAQQP